METHNSFFAPILEAMKNAPKGSMGLPQGPDRKGRYKENMQKVWQKQRPEWLPLGSDNNIIVPDVLLERPAYNKGGRDWFGVEWEYVPVVGAPSIKPGFQLFEDIEDWEEKIVFPDLEAIDWELSAQQIAAETNPCKANEFVLFNGCFERLHSMMGFENALCALLTDEDSCCAYFDRMADYKIALIDKLITYYDVDAICYHDDWGHKTNTFFSEEVFKKIIYKPTRKIVDYVHSRGKVFVLHCCGKNESLVPYMIDMGADAWESAQMEINDLPGLRKRVGTSIGIEFTPQDPILQDPSASADEVRQRLREIIWPIARDGATVVTHLNRVHPRHKSVATDAFYELSDEIYR